MTKQFVDLVFNVPVDGLFTYEIPPGTALVEGQRVIASFGRRSLTGFALKVHNKKPTSIEKLKEITRVVDKEPVFDLSSVELAKWISMRYLCTLGEALSMIVPGGRRETEPPPVGFDEDTVIKKGVTLSDEQEAALKEIFAEDKGTFYLYGITGSGKTEVFLQTALRIVAQDKSVLYLVPEISLTYQLVAEVKSRLVTVNTEVTVIHSHLTPSQRLTAWQKIRSGESRFVIGARSAVFAPVTNLGLIIVDEEHESSYKSGSTPRYHARQVAMKRCTDAGARLLLGSATPSVESYYFMQNGNFRRLNLTRRLSGGNEPKIKIVPLKKYPGPLSQPLIKAVEEVYNEGKQSILFLNRRGFSHYFQCRSCGFEMSCRHCSVGMTYHKQKHVMICHYCGYKTQPVSVCPECGSLEVGYSGFGTEQVEHEIRSRFPTYRIERLDTDTARQKGYVLDILSRFRKGEIDILLGTQMVAKGLNFPNVKLVGIVMADTGLHMPDFRAAERTFSLIVQVAGRAGRYSPDGIVYLQTMDPSNSAIQLAKSGDFEDFYRKELEIREITGFPPFSRLLRLVFRSKHSGQLKSYADSYFRYMSKKLPARTQLLGPVECPISMINGSHRVQILIKSGSFKSAHDLIRQSIAAVPQNSRIYIEIDVDPVHLL